MTNKKCAHYCIISCVFTTNKSPTRCCFINNTWKARSVCQLSDISNVCVGPNSGSIAFPCWVKQFVTVLMLPWNSIQTSFRSWQRTSQLRFEDSQLHWQSSNQIAQVRCKLWKFRTNFGTKVSWNPLYLYFFCCCCCFVFCIVEYAWGTFPKSYRKVFKIFWKTLKLDNNVKITVVVILGKNQIPICN